MDIRKGVANFDIWDEEHLFYNKHFSLKQHQDRTIPITPHFQQIGLFTFSQFLKEKTQARMKQTFDQGAVTLWDNISINPLAGKEDVLFNQYSAIFAH